MNTFWKTFYKLAALRKEVGCVGVVYDGKMLMGKRRDNGKWTNPGGHLDPGEKPVDGAVRELYEEAGIKVDPSDLKHLISEDVITPKGEKYKIHAYKLDLGKKPPTSMKEDPDAEVHRWQWIKYDGGMSKDVLENLHSPKNCILKAMGILEGPAKAAGVFDDLPIIQILDKLKSGSNKPLSYGGR